MKKLKNLRKLEIASLVCLMLPVIALVEGAKPQPETATFRIRIGTESGDNVVLANPPYFDAQACVSGWGEDDYWRIPYDFGSPFDMDHSKWVSGTFTINVDLVGDDETKYWQAGQGQAHLGYIVHQYRCRKIAGEGKPYEVYDDWWIFLIFWEHDVYNDGTLDRVALIVETDHDSPNAEKEWEYDRDADTSEICFRERPYTLVWYKLVERSVGKSKVRTVQEWKWQDYLRKDTEHNTEGDVKLTFTIAIERLP